MTCTYSWRAVPSGISKIQHCSPHTDVETQMVKIPLFSRSWQIVEDCSFFNREKVGISMLVFYNAWRLKFGDQDKKVWSILNNLMIEWSSKDKSIAGAYSMEGKKIKKVRISGLARTPSWIWVHISPGDRICSTSFAHELVHIAIWALKSTDGDPDHLGHKYSGWTLDHNMLIQEVNATLCGLGL